MSKLSASEIKKLAAAMIEQHDRWAFLHELRERKREERRRKRIAVRKPRGAA